MSDSAFNYFQGLCSNAVYEALANLLTVFDSGYYYMLDING